MGTGNIQDTTMDTLTENTVHDPIALWPAIRYFVVLFAFALMCDAASTILVMVHFGPGIELHPVVRLFSRMTGPVAGPLLGAGFKGIGAIIITLYWRRFAVCILSLASALYFAATCYNIWGIYGRALAP
jgi:hypothetical protein